MVRSKVRQGMLEQKEGLYSGLTTTSSVISCWEWNPGPCACYAAHLINSATFPALLQPRDSGGVLKLVKGNNLSSRDPSCRKVSLQLKR